MYFPKELLYHYVEFLEFRYFKSFLVLCRPHLYHQWPEGRNGVLKRLPFHIINTEIWNTILFSSTISLLWTDYNSTSGRTKNEGGLQTGMAGGWRGPRQWQHCRYLRASIIQKQKTVHGACCCSCSNHCGRQTSPITWWCRKQRRPRRSSKYIHFIAFLYPVLLILLPSHHQA